MSSPVDETQRLRALTFALSTAVDEARVIAIMVDAGRGALGASAGYAWLLRGDDTIELAAAEDGGRAGDLAPYRSFPLAAGLPVCDVVRTGQPVMFESRAAMARAYPRAIPPPASPFQAWAVVPLVVGGRGAGAVSFSFEHERAFTDGDRDALAAITGQVSVALERARLYEALRTSEEQLRLALTAARAATWKVDIPSMRVTRDPSYGELLGARAAEAPASFAAIHPDDRELARAAFERTLRDRVPYEPEVRVCRDDGVYVWVRAHGRLICDEDGAPSVLAGVVVDIDEAKRASLRAEEERRISDTLHRLGITFASVLDHDRLVELITDEVGRLVGAEHGAFVVPGAGVETIDPALAAASTLTVPIAARSGEPFGTLVFGHAEAGRFTADHARLAAGIATQAAVALENARLYRTLREHKDQLELAVERARQADRRKDEFLAMLGHELRNPLAPITTALELMNLRSGGLAQRERDVIRRQVDHLSRLIDDLLDVSRITRGKIQLDRRPTELGAVLAKALEMASPLLEKREQRLAIDVAPEGLPVHADATRLAQVFLNLLTNASKYSEPRSVIEVRARAAGDQIVVEVADEGIGIAADALPHLFELFVQGERTLDRAAGGLGIGLTIARSLCELHGGTVEAASPGPGRGSTFTVTLPRAAPIRHAIGTNPLSAPLRAATGVRVLVVDDNVDAAVMLRELLAGIGHELAVAHDGAAALELASSFRPDVAVLDIGLPVMDGYELARQLRERLGSERLRLIAVTGYGQDGDRARSRAAGFDHHLVKPVELASLAPLIDD